MMTEIQKRGELAQPYTLRLSAKGHMVTLPFVGTFEEAREHMEAEARTIQLTGRGSVISRSGVVYWAGDYVAGIPQPREPLSAKRDAS